MNITMKTRGDEAVGLSCLLWIFAKVFTQPDFIKWYARKGIDLPYLYTTVSYEIKFTKTKV